MFRMAIVCALAVCSLGARNPKSWRPLDGRIIGGHNTSIDKHPYQVSLLYGNSHDCSGSLIATNWVLTAGHCIGVTKYDAVRVGSSIQGNGGILLEVKNQFRHEKFNRTSMDFDFGLIELEQPVTISKSVDIVRLVEAGVEVAPGTLMNVTGWGTTIGLGGPSTYVLQEVQVPYVDQETCSKIYGGMLTDRMFCAGFFKEGGKNACQGDSGGPVVADGVQYGIVSSGYGCALPDYSGVHSKVASVRDWIKDISGV